MLRIGWLVLAMGITTSAVQAQGNERTPVRRGFWINFGVGAGSNQWDAFAASKGGGAFYARLGGSINQQLLLGGELGGWGRSEGNVTATFANTTASLLYYPSPERGLFLKTGLGFAVQTSEIAVGGGTLSQSDGGFGSTLGAGYELQLGRNFFLTPGIDIHWQVIDGESGGLVLVTIGAMWH